MIRLSSQPMDDDDDEDDNADCGQNASSPNYNKGNEAENRASIRARIRKSLSRPSSEFFGTNSPSPMRPKETPEIAKRKLGLI